MRRLLPWLSLGLFLLLLLLATLYMVRYQWQEDLKMQQRAAKRDLNQLAALVRNDLQQGNYQHIGELISSWGSNNERIVTIQLNAANGFLLSDYRRPTPSHHAMTSTASIDYSYRGEAQLEITKDLDGVYQRRDEFAWRLGAIYTVLTLLLVALTRALLVARDQSDALRIEIERRQTAENALQQERDQLELAVANRTVQLSSTNKELEAFSYSVSHDLRAPLRAIDGFSLALLEDYGGVLDDTGHDYLRRVRSGAQKMGALIDDLLQLSRVTRSELQLKEVDLSDLARSIVEELRQGDPSRAVEVAITPGLKVWGDPTLLHVLLSNLLGNAWKFTRKQPHATIELGRGNNGNEPCFFVRDNGAGFDMQYAHKLFVAFQRLHGLDQFEGTGIGLATAQRVVGKHGGRIWATSEIDKGATFFFTLPGSKESVTVANEAQKKV